MCEGRKKQCAEQNSLSASSQYCLKGESLWAFRQPEHLTVTPNASPPPSARVSYAYDKTLLVNTWVVYLRAWDSWVSFNLGPLVCKPFLCKSQTTPQHKKFVEHSVILSFEHKFFHSLCYSGANALLLLVFWFTLFKVTLERMPKNEVALLCLPS